VLVSVSSSSNVSRYPEDSKVGGEGSGGGTP
jgi:hypothetical protein